MIRPIQSYGLTYGLKGTVPVENACKLLVRMGRLELPCPLQALEPKSSASANSATSACVTEPNSTATRLRPFELQPPSRSIRWQYARRSFPPRTLSPPGLHS